MSARALALVALLFPASALAQSATLDRVEDLARLGRTEDARSTLTEWWEGARDGASQRDLQRGLWLRGRLTVDPVQAELDFQRLVVLYPSSAYAPQALLRLAQSAHAQGDPEAAQRHVAALIRDYAGSPTRQEAERWLAAAGPAPSSSGVRAAPSSARGTATGAQPAADATPATGADRTSTGLQPSTGRAAAPADIVLDWSVQFGAFSDEDRAFTLQSELVDAGLAARLVRVQGSGFLHVRIGRFGTREEAARQLQEVEDRGFTAAIVRDDRAEEVVRR